MVSFKKPQKRYPPKKISSKKDILQKRYPPKPKPFKKLRI